jgi:hypothetical protein
VFAIGNVVKLISYQAKAQKSRRGLGLSIVVFDLFEEQKNA